MKETLTYDYLSTYTGMSQMGDSPKCYDSKEDKIVKFRPTETEDVGEKAKKFKKLFS